MKRQVGIGVRRTGALTLPPPVSFQASRGLVR